MHATRLLHDLVRSQCPEIHLKRLQALMAAVTTLLNVRRLSVTALGRALRSRAKVKHNIKRIDRLVSNCHLLLECTGIYRALAQWLISSMQPIIVIDWSPASFDDRFYVLRAAVPVGGRALAIYEEIHPRDKQNNRVVHRAFLDALERVLAPHTQPILVSDAGFRSTWFRLVEDKGWLWVGRVRNRDCCKLKASNEWIACKTLHQQACSRPQMFTSAQLVKSCALDCNLTLYQPSKKDRIKRTRTARAERSAHSRKNAQREREPWLIASCCALDEFSAKQVIDTYATRMQIEEGFRDTKSQRYGLGLDHSRSRDPDRLRVLLLIAALALFLAWLVGEAAKARNLHWDYQSNTCRHRAVLSVITIGLELITHAPSLLSKTILRRTLTQINSFNASTRC